MSESDKASLPNATVAQPETEPTGQPGLDQRLQGSVSIEQTAVAHAAVRTMDSMMPAWEELARQTGNLKIQSAVATVREALSAKLPGDNQPVSVSTQSRQPTRNGLPSKRDKQSALRHWADSLGVRADDAKQMVCEVAEKYTSLGESVVEQLATPDCPVPLPQLHLAAKTVLRYAVKEFYSEGDEDFEVWARSRLELCLQAVIAVPWQGQLPNEEALSAVREGIAAYRCEKNYLRHQFVADQSQVDRFAAWVSNRNLPGNTHEDRLLVTTIYFSPQVRQLVEKSEFTKRGTQGEKRMVQGITYLLAVLLRNYQAPSVEHDFWSTAEPELIAKMRLKASTMTASEIGESHQSTRSDRLLQWAKSEGYQRLSPFRTQGQIIVRHIPDVVSLRDTMIGSSPMSPDDLKEAGYRVLKGLVSVFDPEKHGRVFWAFAEPYVRSSMQLCLEREENVVPEVPNDVFLASLLQEKEAAVAQAPVPAVPAPASVPPDSGDVATVQSDDAVTVQETEAERQARFITWASQELEGEELGDFETAVVAISEKYEPMARGIAHNATIPSSYQGGKKKLKRDIVHYLPEVVMKFDPEAGKHFNQHVQQALDDWVGGEVGM